MTAEEGTPNRRLSARLACQLVVRYSAEGAERPATAIDLSNRGCRLRVGQDLPRGAQVKVVLQPPRDARAPLEVAVRGTVVWCRSEGLSHQVGVAFVDEPSGLDEILASV
jgi:PilZ domain-containing protein